MIDENCKIKSDVKRYVFYLQTNVLNPLRMRVTNLKMEGNIVSNAKANDPLKNLLLEKNNRK